MGGQLDSYYFAPPADPINPLMTESQRKSLDLFGRANAAEFDKRGFAYFVREVYDAFYPGYGDSWPAFHGAVAMTYEQASARGLAFAREDGTTLTYKQGVTHHFTAAMTTARDRRAEPRAAAARLSSSTAAARSRSGRRARANT